MKGREKEASTNHNHNMLDAVCQGGITTLFPVVGRLGLLA